MSKKFIKTSLALAVALAAAGVNAGTITTGASRAVTAERTAASGGVDVAVAASNAVAVAVGTSYGDQDVITFTAANGTFKSAAYALVAHGSNGTGDINGSDAIPSNLLNANGGLASGSTISFRFTGAFDGTTSGALYLVSGAPGQAVRSEPIELNLANGTAGTDATLTYKVTNSTGSLNIDTATAARGVVDVSKEFTANASSAANTSRTISVAKARLLFDDSTSRAQAGIEFFQNNAAQGNVTLTTADTVRITLSGDMSGIKQVLGADDAGDTSPNAFTIDKTANTAVINEKASDLYGASESYAIFIDVDETTALEARSFTVKAELLLSDEGDQTLISSGSAGTWTVDGVQAKISHMTVNAASIGFSNWLKITNEGSTSADVEATVTYTTKNADGTIKASGTTTKAVVKTVAAKSVETVSEAEIMKAAGLDSNTDLMDISITLDVAGLADNIQIHAEKKSGDTRVSLPVSYKNTSRTFFQ